MKIILQQDVPSLGRKRDVKDVSNGYARNFLLPQKLAIPATEGALALLSAAREQSERSRAAEEASYRATADKLRTMTLSFKTKMGERGKAFGSVGATKIAEALAGQGIAADKEWIALDESIKTAGERIVDVKFPHGITGQIKIIIEPEE